MQVSSVGTKSKADFFYAHSFFRIKSPNNIQEELTAFILSAELLRATWILAFQTNPAKPSLHPL